MATLPAQQKRSRSRPAQSGVRTSRLRRLAQWRRRLGWVLLVGPALIVVGFDVGLRGSRLSALDGWHWATYLAAILESLVVWGALLYAAARRAGRARHLSALLFVVGFTLALGGQRYFFQQYNVYVTIDVSWFATDFTDSVANQLLADLNNYVRVNAPPLLVALGFLVLARRLVRPRRSRARMAGWVAPLLLLGALAVPTQHRQFQASTPDVLYLNAAGGLVAAELGLTGPTARISPRTRDSLPVPPLHSRPPHRRNVLLLIMESVRADAACSQPNPNCLKTSHSSQLTPNRFPLTQLRSLDSATAITLAVMWSGLGPHESRDLLHTWPLIFDYARAAGWDTGFWTSQNLMFGNSRLWVQNLGVSKFCSATQLDHTADIDIGAPEHLLAKRVIAELPELREPFLGVIQFSNVHFPYLIDPSLPQPFQPASTSKSPEKNREFFNHYLNAVHQQDRHVAAILRAVRSTEWGRRTVVLYTSDHGEAFREHGQMGHTFSVFDEEIRVPGWVDAPTGTLSENEAHNLAEKRNAFTSHADFTPTILDLMGVWDQPEVARFRQRMLGTSLLRAGTTTRPLPMTNCSGSWNCGFENWGYMQQNLKLTARSGDRDWQCFDVLRDPEERHDLGPAAGGNLQNLARQTFKRLPGQE